MLFKLADQTGRTWPIVRTWNDMATFANLSLPDIGAGKVVVREGLDKIRAEADRLLAS